MRRLTQYPDGSTQFQTNYLDGSPASVSGTAVTPSTFDEGVITTAGTDANGNPDANVLAGSTWTMTTSGGTANTTITYTNVLGLQYLVQQSGPTTSAESPGQNQYTDATTTFDGNDRESSSTGFDGTTTDTIYDPLTGRVGATWIDMNHSGVFAAGVDPKSIEYPTALSTSASTPGGTDNQDLSTTGVQDDNSTVTNGGCTDATTNPDGTSTVGTCTAGPQSARVYVPGCLLPRFAMRRGSRGIWRRCIGRCGADGAAGITSPKEVSLMQNTIAIY